MKSKLPKNTILLLPILPLFLLSWILTGCEKKSSDQVLARVDDYRITSNQLRPRLQNFLLTTGMQDNVRLRSQILNNMINEYVLARYADSLGIDQTPRYRKNLDYRKKQIVLEEFWNEQIGDRISLTEPEIKEEFFKFNQKVRARHLFAPTKKEADSLYALLKAGATFEQLAPQVFHDPYLSTHGGDLGYFGIGDMDPAFEEVAFSLPVGEISRPVQTAFGYSIIKVEDRKQIPLLRETDYALKKKKVRRYLKWKKIQLLERQYLTKILRESAVEFSPEGVQYLYHLVQRALPEGSGEKGIFTPPAELASDSLELPCVSSKEFHWSVAQALEQIGQLKVKQLRYVTSPAALEQVLKGLAAREMLYRKALREGIDKRRSVRNKIKKAAEFEKVRLVRQSFYDTLTVSEQEIREEFEKHRNQYFFPEEAKVQEILVTDSARAWQIRRLLDRGADFTDLVMQYSERPNARKTRGILGWAPRGMFGALQKQVFALREGEIAGPIALNNFYVIIKLLGKKSRRLKTLEEAREEIASNLKLIKRKKMFKQFINQLRARHQIEIERTALTDFALVQNL